MTFRTTHAFVQTRGTARAADYAFLGAAPSRSWWRAYRDATAFDHPTVLVSSDGECWAAYLSGIPSARVDAVGTVVRYTLVLEGPCFAAEAACVEAGVAAWLADVAAGASRGALTAALDAQFPAAEVDRLLTGPGPREIDGADPEADPLVEVIRDRLADHESRAEVEGHVLDALRALPAPTPGVDLPGDWIGSVGAATTRAAFTARVAALVGGTSGRALLLNLVGGPADAHALLDPASPVAVLAESSDPQLARCTALRPVVEAKKATAPPARGAGVVAVAGIAVLPLVVLFVLLATTALMVTLLFWLL